ncbi:MAG: DUF11 domain-containing protein [Opitutae bacterium]|nr:DUF11 domain-containing protein [Opitutae bacterium]
MKNHRMKYLPLLLGLWLAPVLLRAACQNTACVEIGSKTVTVDNKRSALFNAMSEQLTGAPVNLTPAEWQTLANARVTLEDVATALRESTGAATNEEVIGTRFTLRQLFDAAATAAAAQSDTAAASALTAFPADSVTGTVSLGDLVQGTAAEDASLSTLDLANSLLALNAYQNGITPAAPTTLTGSELGLGSSVETVQFSAIVAEPPVLVCGPAGTQFRSAGLRMKLGVDLADQDLSGQLAANLTVNGVVLPAGVGMPSVSLSRLEFYAVSGRADGSITAVDALAQTVTLRARPGVVDLYLGHIDDAVFFDRNRQISPATDLQYTEVGTMQVDVAGTPVTASIRLRSHASGAPSGYETLYYTGPYPETQTVAPDAFFVENLTASLVDNMEFEIVAVDPVMLDPATQAAFDQTVAAIQPTLSQTYQTAMKPVVESLVTNAVGPALESSGTRLGEADITVMGVHLACGPGPHARLQPDHARGAAPGSVVFYPHTLIADAPGRVTFAAAHTAGWSHVLYRDTNANGQIDAGEAVLSGATALAEGERLALIAKVFVPADAPFGARDVLTVRADFILTGDTTVETLTRTDTTTVGAAGSAGLTLVKQVDKASARPGDTLTYTLTYTNQGADVLREVVIYDATPAYTHLVSAAAGPLPAGFSNVTVVAPVAGASGAIRWEFAGELAPGANGAVTFSVRVDQ